ncbi:MAG TPA: hypothetical protein PK322_11675, partial [Opitutaceae bacterium]|nr:hypothetical protein [Opitutaceae bacterium]
MDAEELQNRLGTVSQRAFRGIVGIVLHDVFSLQAINVDGAGDGGRDWLVFSRDGNVVLAAIQDTIQSARWEEKALADAKTAETVHHPNRYYFLTKRHHQQTTVTRLEDEIVRQTGMATTVLEARRIAELIIERSLECHRSLQNQPLRVGSKPAT